MYGNRRVPGPQPGGVYVDLYHRSGPCCRSRARLLPGSWNRPNSSCWTARRAAGIRLSRRRKGLNPASRTYTPSGGRKSFASRVDSSAAHCIGAPRPAAIKGEGKRAPNSTGRRASFQFDVAGTGGRHTRLRLVMVSRKLSRFLVIQRPQPAGQSRTGEEGYVAGHLDHFPIRARWKVLREWNPALTKINGARREKSRNPCEEFWRTEMERRIVGFTCVR